MASKCSSCGAEILWAVTDKGKRHPLDREPAENGNIVLEPTTTVIRMHVVGSRSLLDDPTDTRKRYNSHFRTCPQADEHRRS